MKVWRLTMRFWPDLQVLVAVAPEAEVADEAGAALLEASPSSPVEDVLFPSFTLPLPAASVAILGPGKVYLEPVLNT